MEGIPGIAEARIEATVKTGIGRLQQDIQDIQDIQVIQDIQETLQQQVQEELAPKQQLRKL